MPQLLDAISKNGFWFDIKADASFPAKRDFPPDFILFVGHKPEEYASILRI